LQLMYKVGGVGYSDQLLTGRWSHNPTYQFPPFPMPVVIAEPFLNKRGPLRHLSTEMGCDDNETCDCGDIQTMSHIVNLPCDQICL